MENEKIIVKTSSGGIGFLGMLTIVFVAAKLWGVIDWSWLWVFSPLWLIPAIIVGILLIVGIVAVTLIIAEKISEKKNQVNVDENRSKLN